MSLILNGTTGISDVDGTAAAPALTGTDTNTGIFFPAADTVGVATGGSERVRVDSSGNFGLGVTPSAWDSTVRPVLSVKASTGSFSFGASVVDNARFLSNAYYSGGFKRVAAGYASQYEQNAGTHIWYTAGTSTADSAITFTEAARIDTSGNLLVGKTSMGVGTQGFGVYSTGDIEANAGSNPAAYFNRTNDGNIIQFRRSGTTVGTISVTTSATAYNTSSDYRLKEAITPMTGALAKVAALKPVTYKWKLDGSDGEGFIAHELAEVVPDCVSGNKDAVETVEIKDEEGNVTGTEQRPVYQGIDTSFLVATLTAAIQEQQALITALTTRITALEAA